MTKALDYLANPLKKVVVGASLVGLLGTGSSCLVRENSYPARSYLAPHYPPQMGKPYIQRLSQLLSEYCNDYHVDQSGFLCLARIVWRNSFVKAELKWDQVRTVEIQEGDIININEDFLFKSGRIYVVKPTLSSTLSRNASEEERDVKNAKEIANLILTLRDIYGRK